MAILILGSVLLGAVLGRFFKVLVLVPACAFVLVVVLVRSADGEHGLLRPLLEFAVLITSLQIGYLWAGVTFDSERVGTPGNHGRAGALSHATSQHHARTFHMI